MRHQVEREVERRDAEHRPARAPAAPAPCRPVAAGSVSSRCSVARPAARLLGAPAERRHRAGHLEPGPLQRLARLGGDQRGELLGSLGQPARHVVERGGADVRGRGGALAPGRRSPRRPRSRRRRRSPSSSARRAAPSCGERTSRTSVPERGPAGDPVRRGPAALSWPPSAVRVDDGGGRQSGCFSICEVDVGTGVVLGPRSGTEQCPGGDALVAAFDLGRRSGSDRVRPVHRSASPSCPLGPLR